MEAKFASMEFQKAVMGKRGLSAGDSYKKRSENSQFASRRLKMGNTLYICYLCGIISKANLEVFLLSLKTKNLRSDFLELRRMLFNESVYFSDILPRKMPQDIRRLFQFWN